MTNEKVILGSFIRRLNRFVAEVEINGEIEKVHIKNTGRLKELLKPGALVQLEKSTNPNRKTKYSLIATKKNDDWVNIDSQAPNKIAYEALQNGRIIELGFVDEVKREVTFSRSRFDLAYRIGDVKGFIEVKGVTLINNQTAMFPDAPTERGTKHIRELIQARQDGYGAIVLFVVMIQGCHIFSPNREIDAAFADALKDASEQGVQILAYNAIEKDGQWMLDHKLPVVLS